MHCFYTLSHCSHNNSLLVIVKNIYDTMHHTHRVKTAHLATGGSVALAWALMRTMLSLSSVLLSSSHCNYNNDALP